MPAILRHESFFFFPRQLKWYLTVTQLSTSKALCSPTVDNRRKYANFVELKTCHPINEIAFQSCGDIYVRFHSISSNKLCVFALPCVIDTIRVR